MRAYYGLRHGGRVDVFRWDNTQQPVLQRLNPRLDLWDHSPSGYEWGYGGSGPAQLALAVLADVLADDDLARQLHQLLKRDIVAHLAHDYWTFGEEDVIAWVRDRTSSDQLPFPEPTSGRVTMSPNPTLEDESA